MKRYHEALTEDAPAPSKSLTEKAREFLVQLTEEKLEALTESGDVPGRAITEDTYELNKAIRDEIGEALIDCLVEELDDKKVVLETWPWRGDIGFALRTHILENPDKVRTAFRAVLDELTKTLPKKEAAKQKRNRRY
jgi:hypothetical protein